MTYVPWYLILLLAVALWACTRSDAKIIRRKEEDSDEEPPRFI